MRLSRVEIQGFKSFADRTVIKFDADIISIVGPNGCGKSNIADAIRWAMGEQSTKRLRTQEMDNIVFAGSDTRGPMSLAEVSLFFVNKGDLQHPIYGACEEISITRRYFHTGESEYLINAIPCRLKDITELLSASGASSKIYSVIEQGRIGWIVISKPEEKRQIIEEAAGVSIYKSKIASIERKNEKTLQNLQRISDIIREMEINLAHLKRQAQKARRFKKYQDELMDLELHHASHQYLGLLQSRAGIDQALEAIGRKKEEIESAIALDEGEMEVLGSEIAQMDESMGKMQEELYAAQNESALLSANIERSIEDVRGLKTKYRTDVEEKDKIKAKKERFRGEIQDLLEKKEALGTGVEQERAVLRDIQSKLESIKENQAGLQSLYDQNREKMVGLASRIAALQTRKEDGEKSIEEASRKIGERQAEKKAAEDRVTQVDSDIRTKWMEKKEIEQLLDRQQEQRKEIAALLASRKEAIAGQDKRIGAADEEIFTLRSTIQGLEASLNEAIAEVECTRSICKEISSALLSEKIECAEGYERAVSAVLEKFLGCVVVSDMDTALSWHLAMLRQDSKETAFIARKLADESLAPPLFQPGENGHVVPLRSKVTASWDVEELVDRLLHDVYLVADVSLAAALHNSTGGKGTFVTPRGQVMTPEGALLLASEKNPQGAILRLESQIAAHRRRLEELTASRESLAGRHEEVRQAIKTASAQIEEITGSLHETEKNLLKKQQEIDSASTEINTLGGHVIELAQRIDAAAAKKIEAENEVRDIGLALPALGNEAADLEAMQVSITDQIGDVRSLIEEKMILMGSHSSTVENLAGQQAQLEGEIGKLEQMLEELDERQATLEAEIVDGLRTQGRKLAEIFLDGERNEQIGFSLKKLTADIEELRCSLNDRKFKSREKESLVRARRKELDDCEKEMYSIRTRLLTINAEIEKISQNVSLRWRRNLEEIVYDYHNRPAPGQGVSEQIGELTRVLERMGPVNLLAIDDYQQTEEKYQFYVKEKTDLEEAIDKFKQAIAKMNKEYKRKFIEAYEAINANFKQIFPLLFCGGHAYLELLEPDKLLESGVEIKAQPPGKKLGNLDMMSGGEKAMTAIALIFSIFKYRPSPFCILDEVDAPLDEANVKRFNDMLRSMTASSQFILMTHSKLTMQSSDILYGVTMEEPGISRILSTKIEKVETSADQMTAVA